jgi:hypothetical protein
VVFDPATPSWRCCSQGSFQIETACSGCGSCFRACCRDALQAAWLLLPARLRCRTKLSPPAIHPCLADRGGWCASCTRHQNYGSLGLQTLTRSGSQAPGAEKAGPAIRGGNTSPLVLRGADQITRYCPSCHYCFLLACAEICAGSSQGNNRVCHLPEATSCYIQTPLRPTPSLHGRLPRRSPFGRPASTARSCSTRGAWCRATHSAGGVPGLHLLRDRDPQLQH